MAIRRVRQDDLENELNRGALWAVTYGDLMSYLMIFFLMMFTFGVQKAAPAADPAGNRKYQESLVNIQKVFGGHGSSPSYERSVKREKEESMVRQLKESLDKTNLSQYAKLESWDKKVKLVLSDALLFDSGKADLSENSTKLLSVVAKEMKTLPNPIIIEGHTDNVAVRGGRFSSNWELSMARAYAVLRFLEQQGVPSNRLAGIGYGEFRPMADNNDPAARAKNRRIEIDLLRTE